jgi:hypothetical protein
MDLFFSTAILCTSLIFSTDLILNSPPTLLHILPLPITAPVVISPDVGKFNCPIFSSTVILAINSATNLFGFICNFFYCSFGSQKKALKVAVLIIFIY